MRRSIAAIYGVEERALVMELVEGPTLSERIVRGRIPLDDALTLAKQIAEALEYAHERGVVHRDLKPSNIKITRQGRVKVLDFGLAKALENGAAEAFDDPANSTLFMSDVTGAGTLIGTGSYMSPEQARGQSVDRRADIWAFGVVLYEMLTGRRLFEGATISDTIAAVLKSDINISAIPPTARDIVERCLRRDLRLRWQCMGDVRLALEERTEVARNAEDRAAPIAWMIISAILALSVITMSWFFWRTERPVEHPLTRLNVGLGPDALTGRNVTAAISPDGRRLVFPVRGAGAMPLLATRRLDQAQITLLQGTENAFDPFFSPDGRWLGFFADGGLKKISLEGGAPVWLCAAQNPRGGSWGGDGNIVVTLNLASPLTRISAAGGAARPLTKLGSGEVSHRWPQILTGSNIIIFTASTNMIDSENASIEAISLKTGQVKTLLRGGYAGRYLPSGHLVYIHQGVLFGVAFDLDRLEVRGPAVPLLEDVASNPILGGGQFSFSESATGTFLYLAGKGQPQKWRVAWLTSSGPMQPIFAVPDSYTLPRISPDGRAMAFNGNGYLGVYDTERETTTRVATGNVASLAWTPDGRHIVFGASAAGFNISWIRSDGTVEAQRIFESQYNLGPWSFSPDGRLLAYFETRPDTGADIWILPLDATDPDHPKSGEPHAFLRTSANELLPMFSPDGHWIAYRSDESGSNEIYVRPFPNGLGGKWQISAGGGLYAVWSKNSRELFYETADYRIMGVKYRIEDGTFVPGKPRLWSDRSIFYPGVSNLDLAPDGKRFAVLTTPDAAAEDNGTVQVIMLQNFFDELKRKIPTN